jgi:tetratricopeptide (TPR) repeat protein
MSGSLWAAQANLLDIERSDTAIASTSGAGTSNVLRQAQFSLCSTDNAAGRARIVETEQQNLLVPAVSPAGPAAQTSTGLGLGLATSTSTATSTATADGANTPSAAPAPDERPLWRLLHDNRLAEYDRNIASITRDFPSWTPPQALAAERARRQQEADIAAALNGEPAALRLLIARVPEAFGCAHIDRIWKAADVFARTGHVDEIYPLYRTVIPTCEPARNRFATLYRAEHELSPAQADALIELEASQGRRNDDGERAFQRLRYLRAVAALGSLPPDTADAAQQLATLAPSIHAYRDAPAATLAGWIELAQHQTDAADDWFSLALSFARANLDATLGLAQVRIEQRDPDAAQALLDGPSLHDEPRARKARAQIALVRATNAYEQRHYLESLQLLDSAASEGLPAAASDMLRGWNLYALGRYTEAAGLFRAQYDRDHNDDSAEGLALAMRAMHRGIARRHDAATEDNRMVQSYLHALDAQQLYYRKEFVASRVALRDALAGTADSQRIMRYVPADLSGIDAASVSGGLTWSDHVGASGQGRLDTIALELRGEWIHNTTQFELRYRQLFLNAGKTWPSGSARAEELQFMVADTFRLDTLSPFDWSISLGATRGSPAGFQPDAQVNVGQRTTWGTWSAYGGLMPVRDSLLSWQGITSDGKTWGAVRRSVGGAQIHWQVAPRWNINAAVELQQLTGMNVDRNRGGSADLSGGYDFHVPRFDYFTFGPALHYLSYVHNENFYSTREGGYYSPQSSLSTGVALQWLSQEGRSWQWQGSLETGWNDTIQHAGSCPSPSTAEVICAGSHDRGPYGHAQLAATIKLSSHWQAGALVDANVTPGRDKQFAALTFLRYFFEPRAAVFSRDLPHTTRDFYLQLDDSHN